MKLSRSEIAARARLRLAQRHEHRDIGPLPERAWFWRDCDLIHLRVRRLLKLIVEPKEKAPHFVTERRTQFQREHRS